MSYTFAFIIPRSCTFRPLPNAPLTLSFCILPSVQHSVTYDFQVLFNGHFWGSWLIMTIMCKVFQSYPCTIFLICSGPGVCSGPPGKLTRTFTYFGNRPNSNLQVRKTVSAWEDWQPFPTCATVTVWIENHRTGRNWGQPASHMWLWHRPTSEDCGPDLCTPQRAKRQHGDRI